MPICIECRYPVHQLYTTYSKADDRSLGKGVRLTQCPRCKRFADKYVEHDFVVLFIDLVLIKPQVYRHLLFNRLGRENDRFDPSIRRLGVLLLLFDVYLTLARIEKAGGAPKTWTIPTLQQPSRPDASAMTALGPIDEHPGLLARQSVLLQYLFFVALCALETVAFHVPIRLLTSHAPCSYRYPFPNRVSTALLVSSCTKLFPILMVVWNYDLPSSASAVSWAVIVNNVAALEILLDCGYINAAVLAGVGAVARGLLGWALLRAVGVAPVSAAVGIIETGDLISLWTWVAELFGAT